jgi:hypothetical protein
MRVSVVSEPAPPQPGNGRREPAHDVSLVAKRAGATVFDGPAAMSERVMFSVAPGPIELRATVRDAGGATIDQEIRTIEIPDLTALPAISTPRVFRARTAREFQAAAADAAATPTASREFSRTERLLIRFDAYAAAGEEVEATAALLNRMGRRMSEIPIAAAAAGGTHQINLSLAGVPAGEYLVEIAVKTASGEAKELVPLRIGS